MTEQALDFLRQDALVKRVMGAAEAHRIAWSTKDIARIRDHIWETPEKALREAPAAPAIVEPDLAAMRRNLADTGVVVKRDMQPDDLKFVFRISGQNADLMGDVILIDGWDFTNFAKNPTVLNAHDSSAMPIATSTMPWKAGTALMAIAKFPAPGVSAESDQVAAAIRASLVRGASVGFRPLKWTFSSDPARPFGIDFQAAQLLEWSVCSVPCNPTCLVIGAASDGKSASDVKMAALRRSALELAAKGRALADAIPPMTRGERLAEAQRMALQVDRLIIQDADPTRRTAFEQAAAERLARADFMKWRDRR